MKNKSFTHADHLHQHQQEQEDKEFKLTKGIVDVRETPAAGGLSRMMNGEGVPLAAQPDARHMGANTLTIDDLPKHDNAFTVKPMQLSPGAQQMHDDTVAQRIRELNERSDEMFADPYQDPTPRPGHHHHTFTFSRDDERKNRAAMLSREINTGNSDREALRHRCHAIINSWEHMESDKEIALLALEQLAQKAKL